MRPTRRRLFALVAFLVLAYFIAIRHFLTHGGTHHTPAPGTDTSSGRTEQADDAGGDAVGPLEPHRVPADEPVPVAVDRQHAVDPAQRDPGPPRPRGERERPIEVPNPPEKVKEPSAPKKDAPARLIDVEVWGKAAIGDYFWTRIVAAPPPQSRSGGAWSYGEAVVGGKYRLRYRTGPGFREDKMPRAENVILILNGREESKIQYARKWLDAALKLPTLRNLGLVLHGSEDCRNPWLVRDYLPRLKFAAVVYGESTIPPSAAEDGTSDRVFQWPLGVASYRGFPKAIDPDDAAIGDRPKLCNMVATVYPNSSREGLAAQLQSSAVARSRCLIKNRNNWAIKDTADESKLYLRALLSTDYTLSPAGMNTECYRIWEAIECGSIPVIEDARSATCPQPMALLHDTGAPVVFVQDWEDTNGLLERLAADADAGRSAAERERMLAWYEAFKERMRARLVRAMDDHFALSQPQ